MSFEEWMQAVDRHISSIVGLVHNDLPDIRYYDMFEDEVPPQEAAEEAIMEAGGEALL